jgi:hypothetical protein
MIVAVAAFFLFLYFLGEATDARRMDPSRRARRSARLPEDRSKQTRDQTR